MNFNYDGSGAQVFGSNPSAYYAMRNYFLFKNTMSQVYPGQYSEAQYRSLLQTELNENRPIIFYLAIASSLFGNSCKFIRIIR